MPELIIQNILVQGPSKGVFSVACHFSGKAKFLHCLKEENALNRLVKSSQHK